MKIVIEIGDEHYERIMRLEEDVTVYPTTLALYEAVKNGTPLTKDKIRVKEWLESFNTESATDCFTAIQRLKEAIYENKIT